MSEFSESALITHIQSLECQTYPAINATLLIDEAEYSVHQRRIDSRIGKADIKLLIKPIPFYKNYHNHKGIKLKPLGLVIYDAVHAMPDDALFCIVNEGQTLFSDHLSNLVSSLVNGQADNDKVNAAAATLLIKEEGHKGSERLKLKHLLSLLEIHAVEASARFLIKKSADFNKYAIVLPYLNQKAVPFLASEGNCTYTNRVSASIKIGHGDWDEKADFENQVIMDYFPIETLNTRLNGQPLSLSHIDLRPAQLSLENMSIANKNDIVRDLFLSLPVSHWLKRLVFRGYKRFKRPI